MMAAHPGPARLEPPSLIADRWSVRLLGDVEASGPHGTIRHWPSRAVAVLLARLALAPRRAHPREELVELLWPGVAPDVGRNRLRQALSTLRTLLEQGAAAPVIVADRMAVRVAEDALRCDAIEFERLVREGQTGRARALYGGELMPGHFDDWVVEERHRLAALADRLPEPAVDPGAASASHRTPTMPIPRYLTRYVAAGDQGASVRALIAGHRLVTLLGPGGSGKTRLAVELAQALRDAGDAGTAGPAPAFDLVAFVPLAPCTDATAMHDALRAALGLAGPAVDADAQLAQALAGRDALLVLDNLEQLLPAAAGIVEQLLQALPRLRVLATSRIVLGVPGEREHVVPPLAAPGPDSSPAQVAASPAVALFVDRARAVQPGFAVDSGNAPTLARLTQMLAGLPLAIELAAARSRTVPPERMLERLSAVAAGAPPGHGRGLPLLTRPPPAAGEARHASMEQVIGWSWQHLDAAPRDLLEAMTVFPGGCTAGAAQAVAAEGADVDLTLDTLTRQSLLAVRHGRDGQARFWMAEPVREFVHARLAHERWLQCRAAQRRWCLGWATALGVTPSLRETQAEMPNVLAALSSAVADGCPDETLRIAIALRPAFNDVVLPASGLEVLRQALAQSKDTTLRAPALTLLALVSYEQGERDQALDAATGALEAAEPGSIERARALHTLASLRWRISRDACGLDALLDEALAIAERHDHDATQASVHALRGFIAGTRPDGAAEAEALQRRALALWQRHGNRHAVNSGLYNLAVRACARRAWAESLERLDTVCAAARDDEDWAQLSQALNVRGNVLAGQRDWPAALVAYREAADIAWATANPVELCYALWNAAATLAHLHRPRAAAQVISFAAHDWETRFGTLSAGDRRELRRLERLVARQSGRARWTQWRDEGRTLGPQQALRWLDTGAD